MVLVEMQDISGMVQRVMRPHQHRMRCGREAKHPELPSVVFPKSSGVVSFEFEVVSDNRSIAVLFLDTRPQCDQRVVRIVEGARLAQTNGAVFQDIDPGRRKILVEDGNGDTRCW
jgi:hypothetical protein